MDNQNEIKLSIIIINWNTKDLLQDCLSSLKEYPPSCNFEIIVVDNASDDGSDIMLANSYPTVRSIRNEKNIGFAAANNQALTISKGDFLLLLNPDTVVLEKSIENMLSYLEKHAGIGVVGPKLLNSNYTTQPSSQYFPSLLLTLLEASLVFHLKPLQRLGERFDLRYWAHNEIRSVDWVTGACMLIRREVLDQVGGMDEAFFMYSEETDWCYRIRQVGWDIYFYPESKIIHYGGASADLKIDRMKATWTKSYVFFYYKHYGAFRATLARLILSFGYLWRLIIWGSLYILHREKRETAIDKINQWSSSLRWCLFGDL